METGQATLTPVWLTRAEAAAYLRVSVDSVDRRLTEWGEKPVVGLLRFRRIAWDGCGKSCGPVRIFARDVFAVLPDPGAATSSAANPEPSAVFVNLA